MAAVRSGAISAAGQVVLDAIVKHHEPSPAALADGVPRGLADALKDELPELALAEELRPLVAERLEPGPALHLDDNTGIDLMGLARSELGFYQERAFLRAGDGDLVATSAPATEGFQDYLAASLGLGRPVRLHAQPHREDGGLAAACWEDREVRHELLHALRSGMLDYIHPHMGCEPVWELAHLLRQTSRRPLKVVAPPPGLTAWVNDKGAFARLVVRMMGASYVPRTEPAGSAAKLSERLRSLAGVAKVLAVKTPSSAGGRGNFLFPMEDFRGLSLKAIRARLAATLPPLVWETGNELLVMVWESAILHHSSVQTWIPPPAQDAPIIEGIFEQAVDRIGGFEGSQPLWLPPKIEQEVVDRSWLLAKLYQELGYVGRCSFDFLLVGEDLEGCRMEFIECNGRWGGASAPMTLVNRLLGDWRKRPYATRTVACEGLDQLAFEDLLRLFEEELFDSSKASGRYVFVNPGRMAAESELDGLAFGGTIDEARGALERDLPHRLQLVLRERPDAHVEASRDH